MEANEKLAPIHNRQPIMLKHNEARDYLNGKDRFTSSLSRRVEFYPVDRMMNSPNVNNEKNIEECKI
jgi:putative SOS response-associated peptidase YedK